MANSVEAIGKRIPTNLITGFLGSGKTTTLLNILQQKPAREKWAVLVNEFGEIGIDGAIIASQGAEIRQIAGGCMCCIAELPMKVALNSLINRVKPDRLLIETTGLGHPQALVDTLTGDPYDKLLELRAIIALLDPRKLREARYLQHPIFRDQLHIADIVAANKADLCTNADKTAFENFIATLHPAKQAIGWITQGQLRMEWLDLTRNNQRRIGQDKASIASTAFKATSLGLPEIDAGLSASIALQPGELFTRREHNGDGYFSCGWLFSESFRFDYAALDRLLSALKIARMKGLIRSERGDYLFNSADGASTLQASNIVGQSIIEMIHDQIIDWQTVEQQLLAAQYRR